MATPVEFCRRMIAEAQRRGDEAAVRIIVKY